MTPQQYERLTELFHAAMETAPEQRQSFLDRVSDDDPELRRELESLLAVQSAAFTEKPLDDIAAGFMAQQGDSSDVPSLAPNTRLDHYEIQSLLGKGGMGEVYLAEDVRLHRRVALKILPPDVANNQDRMRRFEREATAAAALNHPHIAHIYEIGESENTHFIAMEHIDGDTLRNRIHLNKDPLTRLLRYLIQVAEGLAKAHEAGIVHRDLKPDNIMIARDGYAKILDFGLAKLVDSNGAELTNRAAPVSAPTKVTTQHSVAGMVMGTAGYMSPEQAQGRVGEIDHRSDIFSFGCILFEAITGQRPFADESGFKSLQRVVHEAPPLIADFNQAAPADLQRIVGLCLAKGREKRYQTIRDVGGDLRRISQEMTAAAGFGTTTSLPSALNRPGARTIPASARTSSIEYFVSSIRQHKKKSVFIAAVVAVTIVTVVWFLLAGGGAKPASNRLVNVKRLTPDIYALGPTISPNGEYLAYIKQDKGYGSLWLQDMASGKAVQIMPTSDEGYACLQFSPDGKQIYYMTNRQNSPNATIVRIPLWGGIPEDIATNGLGQLAVSPDGKQIVFYRGRTLVIVSTEGKGERDLVTMIANREGFVVWGSQLSWSPDSTRIAVCAVRHEQGRDIPELLDISASDGTRRIVPTPDWAALDDVVWMADGSSLLVTAREKEGEPAQIWRVPYPGGNTIRVTHDSNDYQGISLTADSGTLVAEQYFDRKTIWLASLSDTKATQQLTSSAVAADGISGLAFTLDDKIIFTSPRSGNIDLWRMNSDGSDQQPLTVNAGSLNRSPRLTPDGRYIVFVSSRTGTKHIWRMDVDGRNAMRLTDSTDAEVLPHLSPDGQWVYYSVYGEKDPFVFKVSINGGDGIPINVSAFDAMPSPDGKLLACGVYVNSLKQPWQTAIISTEGGEPLKLLDLPAFRGVKRWTEDSKSLIYINGRTAELWQQPITGDPPTKFLTLSNERLCNFAISPDSKKIAYSIGNETSEAVLITDF